MTNSRTPASPLTLYVKDGCPFCAKAIAAIEALDVPHTRKEIHVRGVMDELLEKGGKDQVPFLISDDGEVNIYESDTIVAYLERTFGTK